jgi:hypothetical protein
MKMRTERTGVNENRQGLEPNNNQRSYLANEKSVATEEKLGPDLDYEQLNKKPKDFS